jgi:Domain of unknown function (DUF4429)
MMGRVAGGELKSMNGTVVWDGIGTLTVRYDGPHNGHGKLTNSLRTRLGERTIPVEALKAVEVSPDPPTLNLVLRDQADPLQAVTGGYFDALIQPYSFPFADRELAESIAADIRQTLVRRDVPTTPAVRWLVAPPVAPDRIEGRDAMLAVDSGELVFAYKRSARRKKTASGDRWSVPLADIIEVEWTPNQRRLVRAGFLRISTAKTPLEHPKPKHDPAAMITERRTDVDALFFAARLLTRIRP